MGSLEWWFGTIEIFFRGFWLGAEKPEDKKNCYLKKKVEVQFFFIGDCNF